MDIILIPLACLLWIVLIWVVLTIICGILEKL